ncbi:phage tail assembly chaperone [Metabacillus fastidiosus]|uniref:phage tail assembly chaperone n=1 Tax=Metabacillus fastidiosus TaxID=1458 RepID=UPI003D2DAB9A
MTQRDMSFFMKGKGEAVTEEKVYVSKRFKDEKGKVIPFIMKPIPTTRIEELEKECMEPVEEKGKKVGERLNRVRWLTRMGIESAVYPNFKDKELLDSYKEVDPVVVVKQVLSVGGEFTEWINAVQRVNGYEEDFEDLVEEAKN